MSLYSSILLLRWFFSQRSCAYLSAYWHRDLRLAARRTLMEVLYFAAHALRDFERTLCILSRKGAAGVGTKDHGRMGIPQAILQLCLHRRTAPVFARCASAVRGSAASRTFPGAVPGHRLLQHAFACAALWKKRRIVLPSSCMSAKGSLSHASGVARASRCSCVGATTDL